MFVILIPGPHEIYQGKISLFGFIIKTYELTNYALVRDWPFIVLAVGIAWGMVLSSLVSSVTFLMLQRFSSPDGLPLMGFP
jgi:uncharacterized membrane protein